jgi:hypothetical protein
MRYYSTYRRRVLQENMNLSQLSGQDPGMRILSVLCCYIVGKVSVPRIETLGNDAGVENDPGGSYLNSCGDES